MENKRTVCLFNENVGNLSLFYLLKTDGKNYYYQNSLFITDLGVSQKWITTNAGFFNCLLNRGKIIWDTDKK